MPYKSAYKPASSLGTYIKLFLCNANRILVGLFQICGIWQQIYLSCAYYCRRKDIFCGFSPSTISDTRMANRAFPVARLWPCEVFIAPYKTQQGKGGRPRHTRREDDREFLIKHILSNLYCDRKNILLLTIFSFSMCFCDDCLTTWLSRWPNGYLIQQLSNLFLLNLLLLDILLKMSFY